LENILFNLEYCRTGLDKGEAQGYIAEHTKFGELVATPESKVNLLTAKCILFQFGSKTFRKIIILSLLKSVSMCGWGGG